MSLGSTQQIEQLQTQIQSIAELNFFTHLNEIQISKHQIRLNNFLNNHVGQIETNSEIG